jgi:hypothetical protein
MPSLVVLFTVVHLQARRCSMAACMHRQDACLNIASLMRQKVLAMIAGILRGNLERQLH